MNTIKNDLEKVFIIKKSKFITKLYKINSLEQINKILKNLKKIYKDSSHICYAYIIKYQEKCSDDGEPSGTAGIPMLNILKKNKLTNIMCVIIRYFGGIKLGAGGLVRAYSNCVIQTLQQSNIIQLEEGYFVELEFSYNQIKIIEYILNDEKIISKEYNDNVKYRLYLSKTKLNSLQQLKNIPVNISIQDEILIEKN